MGQLVVASGKRRIARRATETVAIRVGGSDQTKFTVENSKQVIEIGWAVLIAGGFQQIGVRSHAAFDIRVQFR